MVAGAVARQNDMAVVGRAGSLDDLLDVARATEPDVVVVGLHDSELPDTCLELLLERPRVKVLAIEEQNGRAHLYELRPEQVDIGEVSPDEVVEMIRVALRPRRLR